MPTEVLMPKLGLTMEDGQIVEWKKNEGERVAKGDILYVLETEKVTFEVEATESGVLGKILAQVGDVVPIGCVVAYMLAEGEKLSDLPDLATTIETEAKEVREPSAMGRPSTAKARISHEVRISPLARKMAEQHGLDASALVGTGPEGRIVKEDVLRAIEGQKTVGGIPVAEGETIPGELVPLSSMRRTIARRMVESVQTAPHFWIADEADATEIKALLEQLQPEVQEESGVRLTPTDLIVMVVARALGEHPDVNAFWTEEGIRILNEINVGIATSVPGGLVVPVIRQADSKSLAQIAATRADLVARGREGKLVPDEMSGGTITLNNVGALGLKCVDAIINPPQSAILTVGKITDRAVVVEGEITIRPMMEMSLGVDHRVLDGFSGGRFLARVRDLIENRGRLQL
jgi:pyruvate dehydrogenase E2 component (dihydrolipoamide acetyltransferase)